MTAFFIIAFVGTIAMNALFARKIARKDFRIFTEVVNVVVAILLSVLFVVADFADKHHKVFLEKQTARLELTVNKIYPGAFEKPFSTTEAKEILESSVETFESPNSVIETIAVNFVKMWFDKYFSLALSAINAVEQPDGTILLKDAILSLKSLLLKKNAALFKLIQRTLIAVYIVYFIGILLVSIYLKNDRHKENKSIVFGEQ